jgi:hypothetical protein
MRRSKSWKRGSPRSGSKPARIGRFATPSLRSPAGNGLATFVVPKDSHAHESAAAKFSLDAFRGFHNGARRSFIVKARRNDAMAVQLLVVPLLTLRGHPTDRVGTRDFQGGVQIHAAGASPQRWTSSLIAWQGLNFRSTCPAACTTEAVRIWTNHPKIAQWES